MRLLHVHPENQYDKGYPDITLFSPGGITTFIELKVDKDRVKPNQQAWHDQWDKFGFTILVLHVDSKKPSAWKEWLKNMLDQLIVVYEL